MPMIDIAGDQFHVKSDGPENASVLMLSNSLGTNLSMWDLQAAGWSKRHRVVRYDSRGHGRSAAPDRSYTLDELGRDAVAIMDALKLDRVNWCGLSKGGMVGQWLLVNAPERLDRVVLANTASHMAPRELWEDRIRTATEHGMAALVDGVIERWFTKRFRDSGSPHIGKVRRMLLTTPAHGYAGCCAALRDMDQREAIRSAKNPVLVIVGSQDPATPPAAGQLIHERIVGSKLVTLDAAHLSNIEQPEVFTRAVLDFIKG